ncbi:MAG TPA: hypothetical protein VET25_09815, partial [Aestuariivirgaceae bacterium]|nr:hypothetical protein [Aestuariivirgaceae bacterium]
SKRQDVSLIWQRLGRIDVVQLRLLTDIVAFDLTHVYLMLDVLDRHGEDSEEMEARPSAYSQKHSILRLTLPECHVFLRALREFHGLIEVTTPLLEKAKRIKTGQNTVQASNGGAEPATNGETSLDTIIGRLNTRTAEYEPPATEA